MMLYHDSLCGLLQYCCANPALTYNRLPASIHLSVCITVDRFSTHHLRGQYVQEAPPPPREQHVVCTLCMHAYC